MNLPVATFLLPFLFVGMLLLLKLGYRLGVRRLTTETEQERVGLVSIETAIFGLLGLVLAFTYSGASTRFELRRALAIQEANAVGTAWLRLDLLPQPARDELKAKMREGGKTHVAAYRLLPDSAAFTAKLSEAKTTQVEIWSGAVAALRDAPPPAALLLLPALNDLMDTTSTREALVDVHTPEPIIATLALLALFCCVLAGYGLAGTKSTSRYLHMLGFAVVVTGTIYIVLDYDYPRIGLIRVDFANAALEGAVAAMK
jgi:hypothetical protein